MILERYKEDLEKENKNNQRQSEESSAQIESMKSSMPRVSDLKMPAIPSIPKF